MLDNIKPKHKKNSFSCTSLSTTAYRTNSKSDKCKFDKIEMKDGSGIFKFKETKIDKYPDFLCIDADGHIDVIELKDSLNMFSFIRNVAAKKRKCRTDS